MRSLFTTSLAIALVAVLAAGSLLAKTHTFELTEDARLNGVELAAGTYKLEFGSDGKAAIYNSHDGSAVTTARVEVKPLKGNFNRTAVVLDSERNIQEIRTGKEKVVFVR